jgi:uncharacterized membrane protein (UPF0127 family)
MELLENGALAAGKPNAKEVAAAPAAQARRTSESRSHCAYNQTRECFLGLEVTIADLPAAQVGEVMAARPLKSGEGLWLMPYRGIPAAATPAPLDLIYLDAECQVIDTVESFPTFQVSSSSPKPESVLALPAHSIYSSQTQGGDQLVICVAEEMQQQLERLTNSRTGKAGAAGIAGAALLREKPLWSGGPGLLELENRNSNGDKEAPETYVMDLTPPSAKASRHPRNWLERWWSPDPRKAPRAQAPGVAAYYWNGSAPAAHGIRDISSSGLYVVTEERWYPGTLVLMTLQATESGEEVQERTIAVQTRAVRWGPDGVGLQFILPEKHDVRRDKVAGLDAASRKQLDRFLDQLKKVK